MREPQPQARLLVANPAEGVRVPARRVVRSAPPSIGRADFAGRLLAATPVRHRALLCAAAGAGLRWGECAGLAWEAVDLDRRELRVVQVAVETPSEVVLRPFPKSRAGVRTVPLPGFLVEALRAHRARFPAELPLGALVFPSRTGGPLRRNNFRRRAWLPSLVRAGLLGQVVELGTGFRASWRTRDGRERFSAHPTEREAVAQVARHATGGLRFHDLRHSYATWLW